MTCKENFNPCFTFKRSFFKLSGVLVEGYIVRNKTWTLIGSQLSKGQPKVRLTPIMLSCIVIN